MKNYFTIFKLLFKYMFKRSGEKSSKWIWLAYAFIGIAFACLIFFLCWGVSSVATVVASMGLLSEFLTVLLGIACVAVVFFGIVPMLNYLYFSRDTEFMMSLPVKPSTVFMAKLSVVYLTEIVVSTLLLIPVMITVGVTLKLSAVFYIVSFIAILTVPSLPLVLIAIIAIPLMYIVSFFKNKGALTSIVLIVLFGLVFAAYYYFVMKMSFSSEGEDFDPQQFVNQFSSVLKGLANVLLPLAAIARLSTLSTATAFGEFSVGAAAAVNAAIFVVSVAILMLVAILVSSAVYKRGARSMLEGGGKKTQSKIEFSSSGSAFSALFKKEWRELFRTPAFAFQCLSGVVLCPIILFFMSSMTTTGFVAEAGSEAMPQETVTLAKNIINFIMICFVGMFGVSMNTGAATTITREGANFWMLKTIPVSYRVQIRAKITLYLIISSLTVLLSLIVISIGSFNVVNLICGIVFLLLYNYGYNCFCIYMDLYRPKLNWTTPNEAVKNNRNAVVPMFINMAVSILLIAVPVLCLIFISSLTVAMIVSWAVLIIFGVAVAVVFHNLLYANLDYMFDKLSV